MSLADKIVKVAIDGMPINPLEKLFIKFVLGTKLGRKIFLWRMKKNWQSAFGKKGKVDKKKADKAAKGQVDKGKVAKGQEVDKGKVAKGIISTNKKRWPTIFDRVILDENPKRPKSPYEVHLNGENIVSDKEENETSELLRKILLITKPKTLGEGIVSDKDAEMPEMLRKILSLGAVVEPKTPKNPYEVRIDGKLKTAQEILKDITNTSLKDALKDMHRENEYKVLHDILGDNINVKIESLEDLYIGKKKTKEDEKKAVNPYSDEALEKQGLEMQINQVPIGGYGYHEPLKYVKPLGDHIYMYRGAPVVECDGYYYETVIVPKGSGIWKGGYLHKKDFFERYHVDAHEDPLGFLAGINDLKSLEKYLEERKKKTKQTEGLEPWQTRLSDGTVVNHALGALIDPAMEKVIGKKLEELKKKTKQTDDLKPWQHRMPDGTIYATGYELDKLEKYIMPDGKEYPKQIILPDGTVVELADPTPGAEKIGPTKEQIVSPDQNKKQEKNPWVIHSKEQIISPDRNKKQEKNPWVIHSKEQIISPDRNKKQEKNPWVIHLDKIAQNFQKHEDYFKQKYGLTLDGGAIMPAPRTNDISSTLVATKGGRQ